MASGTIRVFSRSPSGRTIGEFLRQAGLGSRAPACRRRVGTGGGRVHQRRSGPSGVTPTRSAQCVRSFQTAVGSGTPCSRTLRRWASQASGRRSSGVRCAVVERVLDPFVEGRQRLPGRDGERGDQPAPAGGHHLGPGGQSAGPLRRFRRASLRRYCRPGRNRKQRAAPRSREEPTTTTAPVPRSPPGTGRSPAPPPRPPLDPSARAG